MYIENNHHNIVHCDGLILQGLDLINLLPILMETHGAESSYIKVSPDP